MIIKTQEWSHKSLYVVVNDLSCVFDYYEVIFITARGGILCLININ